MKSGFQKIVGRAAAGVCLLLLLSPVLSVLENQVFAAQTGSGKNIIVLYDDSGSMVQNNGVYHDNWYQAKYAMEVFASMLGQNDSMTILPMSDYDPSYSGEKSQITLYGTQDPAARVGAVHSMDEEYYNTPYASMLAAGEMAVQSTDRETWLIVLTDGAFNGVDAGTVDAYLQQLTANNEKLQIMFLAIGDAVTMPKESAESRIYASHVQSSKQILSSVTETANRVYAQVGLPQRYFTVANGSITLRLDVPMSELVVFAQGPNTSIGDLKGVTTVCATSTVNVKHADKFPGNYTQGDVSTIDPSLQGTLVTFAAPKGKPFSAGTYTLDASGTDRVEIYYKPDVELVLHFTDSAGNTTDDLSALLLGDYTIAADLADPNTGEAVSSELVGIQGLSGTLTNGKDTWELTDLPNRTLTLTCGTLTGSISADLGNYITRTVPVNGTVASPPWKMRLELTPPKADAQGRQFCSTTLDKAGQTILVKAYETDPETGIERVITEDEWKAATLKATCVAAAENSNSNSADVKAQRGTEIGTWVLRLSNKSDKPWEYLTGDAVVNAAVAFHANEHSGQTVNTCAIHIALDFVPWIPWLFGLAVVLFVLAGYVFKKRLPHDLRPHIEFVPQMRTGMPGKCERQQQKRRVLYRLIPYKAEEMEIYFRFSGEINGCSFRVVACGSKGFYIKKPRVLQRMEEQNRLRLGSDNIDEMMKKYAHGHKPFYTTASFTCISDELFPDGKITLKFKK